MTLSRRTRLSHRPSGTENRLSLAVSARRRAAAGADPFFDLTVSNPTAAGLPYEREAITAALASPDALLYEPDPLGLAAARAHVAADYLAAGIAVPPSRIALTASTSEAYAVLFKLLCDPGDEILVPVPSYPLLEWLATFEAAELRTYPLVYAGRWHLDVGALARAIGPRTRAIVVVSPNNPTGSFLGADELEAILDLGLPVVSDEVFARYPLTTRDDRTDSVLVASRGLVFALSGLSKLVGLPQMKLGWIACGGDPARADEAMERLETVLDAYLSVGAPVQHALPELLRAGKTTADAIRARTRENLETVRALVREAPSMSLLDVEGGWYAMLRVPETKSDEEWALALLEEEGVYVHPGYFFDIPSGAHLVVSLLTPEATLREGMGRIARRVAREP
jgi:aspartate/methionine/tyrosine aminotransferase